MSDKHSKRRAGSSKKKSRSQPSKSKSSRRPAKRAGKSASSSRPAKKGAKKQPSARKGAKSAQRGVGATAAAPLTEEQRVELNERTDSLSRRLADLRSRASLADLRDQLEDLDSNLTELPSTLEQARQGGYVYKAFLENKIDVLQEQWQDLRHQIDRDAAAEGRMLVQQVDSLQNRLSAMGTALGVAAVDTLERDISALAGRVDDAAQGIRGTFDTITGNIRQTQQQVQRIRWVQEQLAGASFRLRVDENVIDAVEGEYLTEGDEGPDGILFVTDQRLLFEQKEDVATKKFLFITTEKERVQRMMLETPIGAVQQARASERGAIFKKEILTLEFSSQAPVSQARFRLQEDSEAWQTLIGRITSGEIDGERVGAAVAEPRAATPEEEAAAPTAPTAAPTQCPTCGAALTTEIVRGMRSVTCEYCGTVIPLP